MRAFALLFLSISLAALTGCGLAGTVAEKAAEKAAQKAVETATGVSVKDDKVTIKGEDGKELTITSSEGKLPAGFPIPILTGGKVLSSSTMQTDGKKGWTAEVEFSATPKEVGDYYEQFAKGRGMAVTRVDANDDFVSVTLMAESEKENAFVTITQYKGEPTVMNLMWGDR